MQAMGLRAYSPFNRDTMKNLKTILFMLLVLVMASCGGNSGKKAEKEKDEAISKFLNYFLDEDIQLKLAKKRGTLPLKLKYYSYPIVSDFN